MQAKDLLDLAAYQLPRPVLHSFLWLEEWTANPPAAFNEAN